ncbi:MAG: TonB-dependent receptor, partial [Acidobacteria bacterium]|nr:TonB-dependent receptor [Acidobacteriota bacterium]
VVLPKVYNGKNRTFFFATYEPLRQLSSYLTGPTFARVPTDLELGGDFSQSVLYDSKGAQLPYPQLYNHFSRDSNGTLRYLPNPNYNPALAVSGKNPLYQYTGFGMFNPNDPNPARVGRVLVDSSGRSYVNPAAAAMARALYPRPAFPMITSGSYAGSNYAYFPETNNNDNRYSAKIDHKINDMHLVTGKFNIQPLFADRYYRDPVGMPGTSDTSLSRQGAVTVASVLRPNLVNEFRGGFVWGNFARNFPSTLLNQDQTTKYLDLGGAGKGVPNPLGFGIANFYEGGGPTGNQVGFDRLGINGIQNISRNTEATYSVSDDLSWIRGSQTVKLGFSGGLQQSNVAAQGYGYLAGGRWNFRGTGINASSVGLTANGAPGIDGALPADATAQAARTGDNFAAFLEGVPTNALMYDNVAQPYYYRWMNAGAYVQDDWKIRPNLTLNIGVRYQFQSPRWEKYNRQGQLNLNRLEANPFNSNLPSPVFEFGGFGGRARYLTPAHYRDFEPRFGFAWTPNTGWNSSKRLVVRGGYGITHSILTGRSRYPYPNIGGKLDAYRSYTVILGTTDLNNPSNAGGCGLAICDPSIPGQFGYNNMVPAADPSLFILPANGEIHPGDAPRTVNGIPQQDKRYPNTGFTFAQNSRTPMVQNYSLEVQYEVMRDTVLTIGGRGSPTPASLRATTAPAGASCWWTRRLRARSTGPESLSWSADFPADCNSD